jgi:salicylate hydroxylase
VKKTGLTCYRIAVSTENAKTALGDIPLPHWWDPSTCQNRSSLLHAADGTSRMVTAYPIRDQTMFNLSCIIKTEESTKPATESWNATGDPATVVDMFGDFHESLVKILRSEPSTSSITSHTNINSAVSEVKVWELQDLDPIPTWTRGRAILIGDAAHAMTPMQGQGANMCIEDAESFRLFVPGTRPEEVQDILKIIGTVRKARTAEVLAETRKSHSTTGVGQRVLKNLEFNCGYKGIFEAVKSFGDRET